MWSRVDLCFRINYATWRYSYLNEMFKSTACKSNIAKFIKLRYIHSHIKMNSSATRTGYKTGLSPGWRGTLKTQLSSPNLSTPTVTHKPRFSQNRKSESVLCRRLTISGSPAIGDIFVASAAISSTVSPLDGSHSPTALQPKVLPQLWPHFGPWFHHLPLYLRPHARTLCEN